MSDEGGDRIDGEEELAGARLACEKEIEEYEATHVPFRDWCTHCV